MTTGSNGKFMRLTDTTVFLDTPEYYLAQIDKIFGILLHTVGNTL